MKANTVIILLVPILLAIHFAEATASYGTSAGYVLTKHTESDEYVILV